MRPASRIILASSSPYRRELLGRLGLSFDVESPGVDETPGEQEAASDLAERLAVLKARAIAARDPAAIVIGSDQVAECRGQLLGKPGTHERALQQLLGMQGAQVVFHTAVAVVQGAECRSALVPTRVRMRRLSAEQLSRYLQREQPYDCAGAFKSEALGIALLDTLSSEDPTALVGLPLIATIRLLEGFGLELL